MSAADSIRGFLDRIVDAARERPGTVLAWMLGFQLVVWTLMPALVSANLQLDLVEGLALGKEWQLGYWKHPPLPWWVTDLAYRVTGRSTRSTSSGRSRPRSAATRSGCWRATSPGR